MFLRGRCLAAGRLDGSAGLPMLSSAVCAVVAPGAPAASGSAAQLAVVRCIAADMRGAADYLQVQSLLNPITGLF